MSRSTINTTAEAAEIIAELRHFTGDLERFRHSLVRTVIYTPGVKHMAERCEAYWLIDAIVSHIVSPEMRTAQRHDPDLWDFQLWTLEMSENKGVLTCRSDADVKPYITQAIEFTDFPLDRIEIWAGYNNVGHPEREHWTLYLPSEH